MPPRRRPIGEVDPSAPLLCDCARYCKGMLSSVDQRMYTRHAPFRTTPEHVLNAYYATNPTAIGQRVPANLTGEGARGSSAPVGPQTAAARGRSSGARMPPRGTPTRQGLPGAQARPDEPMTQDSPPTSPGLEPFREPAPGPTGSTPPLDPQPEPPRPFSIPGSRPPTPPPPHGQANPDLEDPEEGYAEDLGVPLEGFYEDVRVVKQFIRGLRSATLDSSGLDNATLDRLRVPRRELPILSPAERAALRMFLARGDASEDNYADNRAAIMELHPEDEIPTYYQVKSLVGSYTGIDAIRTDMCINSCVAYTGPFAHLPQCPECAEPRYDPWKRFRGQEVARRTFCTFPIGPQLQTLFATPESAKLMRHRATRTDAIRHQIRTQGADSISDFDDIYYANDYLELVENDTIKSDDIVLMFSLDGAQLYQNKGSDCWFSVWVIFDLPPTHRYRKQYVIPGAVIGGPKKPQNIDSFLYPGFYHLAALQTEGLQIWDADRQVQFRADPFLYLSTADAPGMAFINGLVGHNGKRGCRVYCGQRGFHKPSKPTYYPALRRPRDPSDPDDPLETPEDSGDEEAADASPQGRPRPRRTVRNLPADSAADIARYEANLRKVELAGSQAEYARQRLHTGIGKATILSGLSRAQKPPRGLGLDSMHLIALNLTDHTMSLLRGTFVCEETDQKTSWTWAVLQHKDIWAAHGALVASATRYLPSSFGRPPRNPAQKINSGYKAWEFQVYVYGILPGLLRVHQAPVYYRNFCKLVLGVRILLQRTLPRHELPIAQQCIIQYVEEFEELYYQGRMDRLHFVRPCLHTIAHLASEIERAGLCTLYTQWTLENFIGSITREIRQHVTPYANVSERALRRCQVNALRSLNPAFAIPEHAPRHSQDLGDGFVLLSPYESSPQPVADKEIAAMHAFYRCVQVEVDDFDHPIVARWARLRLPTGQNARTAWKEKELEANLKEPRRARMVKLRDSSFAEVQYFFQNTINNITTNLAMVSLFSLPDPAILIESSYTVLACKYQGNSPDSYKVIDLKDIATVVAMVPLPMTAQEAQTPAVFADRFYAVEKPGLGVAFLAGHIQPLEEDGDN